MRNAPASPASPAIEVRGLTLRYDDVTAVDDLSFVVEPGVILALLGPNGAGKTSTVETLEGFRRPDAGTVRVLGFDPVADHGKLMAQVGVMLQEGGVYPAARPPEVLRLFASFYAEPADPDELLDRVGLREQARTPWRHLSGGEQQRLSLALALIGRPTVAFLDEPTAGIDPQGRQLIRAVVSSLRDEGVTVLLTTHDLDEAEKLADQVVIIDHGRVLASGTPAALMAGGDAEQVHFGAAPGLDVAALSERLHAPVHEVSPGEYRAELAPTPAAVAAITGWLAEHDLALADLRAGRQSLEDVFLRLTEAARAESSREPRDEAGGGRGSRRSRRPRSGRSS